MHKALLVDDDTEMVGMLRDYLQRRRQKLETLADGKACILTVYRQVCQLIRG